MLGWLVCQVNVLLGALATKRTRKGSMSRCGYSGFKAGS